MGSIIFNIIMKYVSQHPDQIVELLAEGVKASVGALKSHNANASAPTPTS